LFEVSEKTENQSDVAATMWERIGQTNLRRSTVVNWSKAAGDALSLKCPLSVNPALASARTFASKHSKVKIASTFLFYLPLSYLKLHS
jgi:hypothetical protein